MNPSLKQVTANKLGKANDTLTERLDSPYADVPDLGDLPSTVTNALKETRRETVVLSWGPPAISKRLWIGRVQHHLRLAEKAANERDYNEHDYCMMNAMSELASCMASDALLSDVLFFPQPDGKGDYIWPDDCGVYRCPSAPGPVKYWVALDGDELLINPETNSTHFDHQADAARILNARGKGPGAPKNSAIFAGLQGDEVA